MALTKFSLNEVRFLGSLGQDADVRTTTNGTEIATFSIGVTENYKSGESYKEKTLWLNINVWKPSDYLKKILKKGNKILVCGRLDIEEYTDKDGNKKKATKVTADLIVPVKLKEAGETNHSDPPAATSQASENTSEPEYNDDLPF